FMHMLAMIVANLHNADRFIPSMQALGRRHVEYGVRHDHYDTFRSALLSTLEHILGDDWTSELRHAWSAAYRMIANAMREATTDVDMELLSVC
ncbi:MAG TPA: globin domain-containing protein, partial [Thermoanaerobaculia bacterium]|nr:globin domain-containing protein [Thermoanaerobaculia bacterium]